MARFNTQSITTSVTAAATIASPQSFTEFTGTAPYTVTLPSPVLCPGSSQTFYNATAGTVTISTPSGLFGGLGSSGASTQVIPTNTVVSITSDGTNYVVLSEDGSALVATTGSFTSNVTANGATATVSLTPQTVTIAPTGASTIDNVNIGATTRGSGAFNTLTANSAVTFTANTTSSSTTTGTVVVTGGLGVSGAVYAAGLNGPLTGTIQTASQPNITSTGSLTVPSLATNTATGITFGSAGSTGTAGITVADGTSSLTDGRLLFGNGASTYAALRMVFNQTTGTQIDSVTWGSSASETNLNFQVNGGKVGIGTNSPSETLHVSGTGDSVIRLASTAASGKAYNITSGGNGNYSPGVFAIRDVTAGTTPFSIYASNVGINTTSPQGKLTVSNAGAEGIEFFPAASSGVNSTQHYNRSGSAYARNRTIALDYTFNLSGAGTDAMILNSSGNLGIGTTNPQAKLHVNAGSGAISIQDYKRIVYNLDASMLENQTYQRFSIGINTANTTYARTSAYVRVTVVPNPDGGIGLVNSSTAEFSIWRIDGNNNANFKIISVANGTIGINSPVASNNSIIFGFNMPNNGTGTTPSFTIRIEIMAADVGNYVITPITTSTYHTGASLSGVSIFDRANSAYFGSTPYTSVTAGSQVYTSANAASNPNGNEANAVTGWAAGYAGLVPTSVGTDNGVVPYAGSYQLKFTGTVNGYRSDYGFQATAGRRYLVSFWGNQYQGQYYFIGYIATTAGGGDNYGTWVNLEGAVALNNVGWTQYQLVFTATVSQLYYLSIRMATNSSPGVIFYLDNISITELQGSNLYANGLTAGGTSLLSTVTTGSLSVLPAGPMAANISPTLGNGGIRVFGQNPTITLEGDSLSYYPSIINKGVNGTMSLGTYYSGGWYNSSGSQHSFTLNNGSPALTLTGNGLQIDNQKTGNIYATHQIYSGTKIFNLASTAWLPIVFVNHTCSCNVNIQVYHPSGVNNGSYMWSGVIGGGYGAVTTTQTQSYGLGTSYITGVSARYNNSGYNLEVQVTGTFGGNNPVVYFSVSGLSYGTLTAA